MYTTGDLLRLFPELTHSDIHNCLRVRYLEPIKQGERKYRFFKKDVILLKYALPLWKEQRVKQKVAFDRAKAHWEYVTQKIWEEIADYRDKHSDRYPTRIWLHRHLEHRLSGLVCELGFYLDALIEKRELMQDRNGALIPTPVYRPLLALLARTSLPQPAYTLLPDERKTFLRKQALELYRIATRGLPDQRKIPVPVYDILNQTGYSIEHRLLDPGYLAYIDPEQRKILISPELSKEGESGVLAHELFHDFLAHSKRNCASTNDDILEAEATYAAAHLLAPLPTFQLVFREVAKEIATSSSGLTYVKTSFVHRLARRYEVSDQIIEHHLDESPQLDSLWHSISEEFRRS